MVSAMFYVGTGLDKHDKPVQGAIEKIAQCAGYLSKVFGGCSVIERVNGHWLYNSKLISEDSKIFEVVTDAPQEKIKEAASYLRDTFNQTSVLLRMQEVQADFI